jgi:hypothetical protein
MQIQERHVLDHCQIIEESKCILVRTRIQKWVISGDEEMLVQDNAGYHRVTLNPGNWADAVKYDVKKYADVIWTEDVVDEWNSRLAQHTPALVNPNLLVSSSL